MAKPIVLLVNCFHARKGKQGSNKWTKNGSSAGFDYRCVSLLTEASFMLVYNLYNTPTFFFFFFIFNQILQYKLLI